jgi:hypothetical protein
VQRPGVSTSALWIALAAGLLPVGPVAHAAECSAPKVVVVTATAMKYCIDPAFDGLIQDQVRKIRQDIKAQQSAGKLIVYASTPISPRGGGYTATNLDVAAAVKAALEKEYGGSVWVLDPGRYQLPPLAGRSPGGSEYLVMWTAVLAGDDGTGQDFDMVHFTGPSNMRAFFGCGESAIVECIDRYVTKRAATDETFRRDVADQPARRREFLRYYAMRASSAYSPGAHDEWNTFVAINRRRPLGGQVAMYFDGRPLSPGEMETVVSPGYEFRP